MSGRHGVYWRFGDALDFCNCARCCNVDWPSGYTPKHVERPLVSTLADGGDTPPLVASVNAPVLPVADSFLADVAVAGRGAAPDRCNDSGAANKNVASGIAGTGPDVTPTFKAQR